MPKLIYFFGDDGAEGSEALRGLLGGKGAGLAEMSRAGVPVPPGFTLTTDVCRAYVRDPRKGLFGAVPGLRSQFERAFKRLERVSGRRLGDPADPLLVSVRSGAKFSMPGMMDTILNLGLNDETVRGLARRFGDERFALDSYRRFVQMFGTVVAGLPKDAFEEALKEEMARSGAASDRELGEEALLRVVDRYLELYREGAQAPFPADPRDQLERAITAVFRSWKNPRAATYRKAHAIPEDLGTACSVQQMVFGNRGETSGSGVGFTRSPATGERRLYGEFLAKAQGEDVVSGARTPQPLAELARSQPRIHAALSRVSQGLERRYRDAQDFEFTVEEGRLYMLQTRAAKRTALAALRIAVDMVRERRIRPEEALLRVSPDAFDQILKPVFSAEERKRHAVLGSGLPAGPGAAAGRVAFSADEAVRLAASGPVILVRPETHPDDIHGMIAAQGILTASGGMTSHAAVVGRGMGKVCVVGCGDLVFQDGSASLHGRTLKPGDALSLDGFSGEVLEGDVTTQSSEILQVLEGRRDRKDSEVFRYYETFMGWADRFRRLGVRANADRPEDARLALLLGAEGIGLCRTEHMFFGGGRVSKMLAMIVADTAEGRRRALAELLPLQKEDFKGILQAMEGLPVTVRTFDPPLHEFLPVSLAEARRRAVPGAPPEKLWEASQRLKELNPMLGHRGCRLGITHPEITEMQARALLSAAAELAQEGVKVHPELMIPLVGFASELRHQADLVRRLSVQILQGTKVRCPVGTMIEVPRAAFAAAGIAREADFFSFGTNDLTQMLLGYSRDDYGKFIRTYLEEGIVPADPFKTLDREGVGQAVILALRAARAARKGLQAGVCGEHGGDPASIEFFHEAGLDYVSCSPYRVPAARLAAAQAALRSRARARHYTTA